MNPDTLLDWFVFGGIIFISLAILTIVISVVSRVLNRRHLLKRHMVLLELTPPSTVAKSPDATRQLFMVVHGLRTSRRVKDKLMRRSAVISFEIVSSRDQGIRYLIQVEQRLAHPLQQAITSYLPDAKVTITEEYLTGKPASVIEFKQTGHYVFPLAAAQSLEQHDPLAYITGAMTKLDNDEQVCFQVVLSPVKLREASILSHRILGNEDMLGKLHNKGLPIIGSLFRLLNNLLFGVTELTGEVYHGTTKQSYQPGSSKDAQFQMQVAKRQRPARTLSAFELELMESMHRKLSQPLFQVSVRALVYGSDEVQNKARLSSFKSALDAFSVPPYQE
ncbi:hypothetical protein E6Q11_06275, partial [Candidatus Dojkabacteria bacterium]